MFAIALRSAMVGKHFVSTLPVQRVVYKVATNSRYLRDEAAWQEIPLSVIWSVAVSNNIFAERNEILPGPQADRAGNDVPFIRNREVSAVHLAEYFLAQAKTLQVYQGQLTAEFQTALARHHQNLQIGNCDFYHTMNLPDGRVIAGEWDLRGHEARYLGGAILGDGYFKGRRVAEFGPASGALTAYMAKQGSEIVAFDLPFGAGPEIVPFRQVNLAEASRSGAVSVERLRNSWWYGKSALGYAAQAVYADIYNLPGDIGRFSVAVFGCILLHLSNPFRALQQIAANVDDTIIITEVDSAPAIPGLDADEADYPAIAAFNEGRLPAGLVHWWSFSPRAIMKMLERLGFETVQLDRHAPPGMGVHTKLFTVVGRRSRVTSIQSMPVQATPLRASAAISLPPPEARFLVSGTHEVSEFARLGQAGFHALRNSLGKAGIRVADAGRVLDFGCGVGRVLRYWADYPKTEIHGCDYQPDAVEWCRQNLKFGRFAANTLTPELAYPDAFFDVVYALSVFTHLPSTLQLPWFSELSRILKPGGVIYFSVHGAYYEHLLDAGSRERFAAGQVVVSGEDQPGTNICAAFHPPRYVERNLVAQFGFTLLEHLECGALGNPQQDSYLMRKAGRGTDAA